MPTLREAARRVWGMLRSSRSDEDLEQELRSHLALAAEARGHRPAAVESAGVAQALEALRDQRGIPWLDGLWRDLRYALRMLAQSPGCAAIAIVSLAIGIGANCAVFSFADTLLLRPLTVPRADGVLTIGLIDPFSGSLVASYRDYLDLSARSRSFHGLVAFTKTIAGVATGAESTPKLTMGLVVSGNFFKVLGVTPQLGRDFRPDEDAVPERDAVVVLSHQLWTEFGADPSIVGRTMRLNGIEFTVVGIAPPDFTGLDQFARLQFYVPLAMWPRLLDAGAHPFEARDFRRLTIAGRLRPGVSQGEAQAELAVVAADWERAYPETNRNQRLVVRTELQKRIAQAPVVARLLALLTLLAAAVLFVACANVAGLLASRAPARAREIAVRLAIGASRGRVTRQLLVESLLIALAGGALGLGVGLAALRLFSRIQIPTDLPISAEFRIDQRALLVSVVAAVLSAILSGLAPSIAATRTDLTAVMKATDAGGFGHRRRWGRSVLVAGQVAVAVVLLVLAAFVYRGFQKQLEAGPGFLTDHLVMMSIAPAQLQYTEAQTRQLFERVTERARLVPGVASVALTRYMPMDGQPPSIALVPEGAHLPPGKETANHAHSVVDEHYFETIGVAILKGRGFLPTDSEAAPPVAVVNEVFADGYWPGQNAVGKRFRIGGSGGPLVEIVGVARTTKYSFVTEQPREFVYFPFRQRAADSLFLLVRSTGEPSSLVAPLRQIIRRLAPLIPITGTRTMEELYRLRSVEVLNVIATLTAALGLMGLALALVGLYGLVAYAASRRTKEIGIRMAIGARRSDVVRMVLRQGLVISGIGLAIGLLAAIGVGRALALVFPGGAGGDNRTDVAAFASVAIVAFAVTQLAAYVPARRASRINPTQALRAE